MDRPKVLIAIKGLGLGGAEKLIAESAQWWDRVSFDYRVAYALPWKDALVEPLENEGVPVVCFGGRRGLSPRSWLSLRRIIETERIDLVHAHLPSVGVVARMVSRAPVVYTEHNLADSYRLPVRVTNQTSYWRNRATIAVSEAVASSIARYPGPAARVVPNGVVASVEPEGANAVRRELGIDDHAPLVVHVGNIRPHKGHENLIAATALLRDRSPGTVVVSLGGEKAPGDLARVQSLASAAGVASSLRFLGSRPDALDFMAAADVVVNPSDVEGLPVSLLEAMALSKPIVATAVGGVPTVIRHRETGLLVEPATPDELAMAIDDLLDRRELAETLGRSARDIVTRDYGLETMVEAVEDIYREVLGV